jgi:hypothetical protein
MKTKTVVSFLLFVLFASPTLANKAGFITIKKFEGRSWLIVPDGQPFFAHGISHARNLKTSTDLDKFSKTCKEIGFNSYGYGCAESLRKDMPFIESWNHFVFGERFAFNTLVPEVVEEMLPYVEAIAIQPPFNLNFQKKNLMEFTSLLVSSFLFATLPFASKMENRMFAVGNQKQIQ